MQRPALISLAAYLLIGGCGFLGAPAFALRLLLANGTYGAIMPRVVGLFMCVLGGVFVQVVRARDYRYSLYTIVARSFIVVVMTALYCKAHDPLFLVLDALVLLGLVPSISVAAQSARVRGGMKKSCVCIFRQGSRILSAEEQTRRTEEVRTWALDHVKQGRNVAPRVLGDERVRLGEDAGRKSSEDRVVARNVIEANDLDEAVSRAKTHPGLRYGVRIEVRLWRDPPVQPQVEEV